MRTSRIFGALVLGIGAILGLASSASAQAYTAEELDELLGPIALYPDTLLANMFAASMYPDDIAKAEKLIASGGKAEELAAQGVEPSVQAVAGVADVLKMLAESPEWTAGIATAYTNQASDVTACVQRLRGLAQENKALESNDNVTVVEDGSTIIIESPSPEVVYVPTYEPAVVYAAPVAGYVAAAAITFGTAWACAEIYDDLDWDWNDGGVCWGNDVDIDVNNVDIGDVNIGNDVNVGNGNGNHVGNQGKSWSPNKAKTSANLGKRPGGSVPSTKSRPGGDFSAGASRSAASARPAADAGRDTPRPATADRTPSAPSASDRSSGSSRVPQPKSAAPSASRVGGDGPSRTPSSSSPGGAGARSSSGGVGSSGASRSSGFSMDSGAKASQDRGSASRSSGGGGASRGGGRGR